MHDYVCFIAPTDYCLKSCVRDFSVKIALISYCNDWFQPNSFGEVCFLEESYKNMQKFQILQILKAPSIQHQWVCL